MFISEEMAAKAEADEAAQAASEFAARGPLAGQEPQWSATLTDAQARASRLRAIADGRRHARAKLEERIGARGAAVKRVDSELRKIDTALGASVDQVNAAASEFAKALVKLRTATTRHDALLKESGARLAGAGLLASDDLYEPGEHHNAGSAGLRGLYLAGTEFAPIDSAAIAMSLVAEAFGRAGGNGAERAMPALGRSLAMSSRLDNRG